MPGFVVNEIAGFFDVVLPIAEVIVNAPAGETARRFVNVIIHIAD